MAKGYIITEEDAKEYRTTLLAIRRRMITSFEKSTDMSYRKWVNKHGPMLDDLLEEIGHKFRDQHD